MTALEPTTAGTARGQEELDRLREATRKLLAYCLENDWAGYDPYDALNSQLLDRMGLLHSKFVRLALTQGLKRCPINFRPLLRVSKTRNPKAIGLFLSALVKLSRAGLVNDRPLLETLAQALATQRSPGVERACWGYSFPWQTRKQLVPRGAPNLVCTTFAAEALLDWFEESGEARWLDMAASAADYLLDELYWTDAEGRAGFSYPLPDARTGVHNANFLGAAMLCRVSRHRANPKYREAALKAARYSAGRQRPDGSWAYGESSTQFWVDNFHTGFNLCALRQIGREAQTTEFEHNVGLGFEFYMSHFFRDDGAPKYFHDQLYPIDIHSAAQGIITLASLRDLSSEAMPLARAVLRWTIENLRAEEGYFYYQKRAGYTNRISYMRWSQAWMLLALSVMLVDGVPSTR
jgi:hypothetical protein